MNLAKLFEMQKELDARILEEHPVQEGEDRLSKKILALLVELGELANEWRGFKYWSNDQKPRKQLLEEYVDCLHFILSIGNDLDYRPIKPDAIKKSSTIEQFHEMFYLVTDLHFCVDIEDQEASIKKYLTTIERFLGLGEMLWFTMEQIEQAYIEKNQVNHHRQENGY